MLTPKAKFDLKVAMMVWAGMVGLPFILLCLANGLPKSPVIWVMFGLGSVALVSIIVIAEKPGRLAATVKVERWMKSDHGKMVTFAVGVGLVLAVLGYAVHIHSWRVGLIAPALAFLLARDLYKGHGKSRDPGEQ